MRKGDWFIAMLLLVMGICCLTVSATSFLEKPSDSYARTLLALCLWIGAPLVVIAVIYLFLSRRRHR